MKLWATYIYESAEVVQKSILTSALLHFESLMERKEEPTIKGTELDIIEAEGTEITEFDARPSAYVENIKVEVYSEYLVPISFGFSAKTDLSAYGIEHLAAEIGISIIDQEWTENETHYFMKATAECAHTTRKSVATVSQPKQMIANEKVKEDPNALEKASRRANRNALRQMIPTQLLKKLIEEAIRVGKAKQSAIVDRRN